MKCIESISRNSFYSDLSQNSPSLFLLFSYASIAGGGDGVFVERFNGWASSEMYAVGDMHPDMAEAPNPVGVSEGGECAGGICGVSGGDE